MSAPVDAPYAGDNRQSDPLLSYQFTLDVNGITGYFTEVTGLTSEHEVVEHKVVGQNGKELVQMIPGRLKWSEITLKKGVTTSMGFWDWRQLVIDGKTETSRYNCIVSMYDRNYQLAAQWTVVRAWPSKISGPEFKSDSNDFAVEEIALVHEGMRREGINEFENFPGWPDGSSADETGNEEATGSPGAGGIGSAPG
ncbi:MAG: hypothetical protein B6242_03320 [Anaerolineaceae bacterium 4572_78]|nr:MAG: hypothetical protein B6242_03320 [Anaerolineaceae bacterium 4572_78]